MSDSVVYKNPWFQVVERIDGATGEAFYGLQCSDYVHVVALTTNKEIVLVQQERPVIQQLTLELPGGHVDEGKTHVDAAQTELFEETGYRARSIHLLGILHSDVGRLMNRLWCFFSDDLERDKEWRPEEGIDVVHHKVDNIADLIQSGSIDNAYNLACIMLAFERLNKASRQIK